MTTEQKLKLVEAVTAAEQTVDPWTLARGYARYEALRKLGPASYAELHRRNLAGERFDDMVDELVVKGLE